MVAGCIASTFTLVKIETFNHQLFYMQSAKTAVTHFPVHELIKQRYSPRSFNEQEVTLTTLQNLIEAASWAFSANNEQPWRYLIANKTNPVFQTIFDSLLPGNQPWAKNAGAFIVAFAKTNFDKEGNPPNAWAEHDLGAANATLALQATALGLGVHPMAGFDAAKLIGALNTNSLLKPVVVFAVGYPDVAEKLPEPFLSRERTPRTRKSLDEIIITPQQ